jgi:hypothetical protein
MNYEWREARYSPLSLRTERSGDPQSPDKQLRIMNYAKRRAPFTMHHIVYLYHCGQWNADNAGFHR